MAVPVVDAISGSPIIVEVVGISGPAGPPGAIGGAVATVSDTVPFEPVNGQLWFDGSHLYIWYTDSNTSQWVGI